MGISGWSMSSTLVMSMRVSVPRSAPVGCNLRATVPARSALNATVASLLPVLMMRLVQQVRGLVARRRLQFSLELHGLGLGPYHSGSQRDVLRRIQGPFRECVSQFSQVAGCLVSSGVEPVVIGFAEGVSGLVQDSFGLCPVGERLYLVRCYGVVAGIFHRPEPFITLGRCGHDYGSVIRPKVPALRSEVVSLAFPAVGNQHTVVVQARRYV